MVKTAEGFEVAIEAKRADIAKETEALHSEMSSFNKAKNTVKSEGAAAGAAQMYPNGKYVNNPKHHMNSRENIGKPPIDGQKALNESKLVKTKGCRNLETRVGVENGKVVKFQEHSPGEFHGYFAEGKLDADSKNALIGTGLMKPNGKIIKR